MSRWALATAIVLTVAAPCTGSALAGQDTTMVQRPFPHATHVGLFPTCDGCHAGILKGDSATWLSVGPEFCSVCHDGTTVHKIEWTTPEHPRTNLRFTHARHAAGLAKLGAPPNDCTTCHQAEGGTKRMQVVMARPALCSQCHGFDQPEHHQSGNADCATCHVPVAQATALKTSDIADFPKPTWHDSADFLFTHGTKASASGASCSVCHARQSCTRCHLNASSVAPIQALAPDARIASLEAGRKGKWPEPPSHRHGNWILGHAKTARTSLSTCASCHAASSCATCHQGPRAGFLSQMPQVVEGGPTGIRIQGTPPGHGPGFALAHGAAAAAGAVTCSSCHTEVQCTACHQGGVPTSPALKAPGTGGSGGGRDQDGPTSLLPRGDRPHGASPATGPRRPSTGPRPVVFLASLRRGALESDRATRTENRFGASSLSRLATTAVGDTVPPVTDSSGSGAPGSDRGAGSGATRKPASPPRTGGFHPPDYVLQHGADAFARRVQCSECHSAQAFCLACHEKMGVGRGGTAGSPAFHDAEPNWLIVHGRAARQNLESCVACHQESSCLRCHSAKFGFRINPHGPGFDPNRIADRSTISCGICHFSLPTEGGG